MKKALIVQFFLACGCSFLYGHFQMVIPSANIIENREERNLGIELLFCHPFEGSLMNMVKPKKFGVLVNGEKNEDLTGLLVQKEVNGFSTWNAAYEIKMPGDYLFYVEPAPYWEPAEGKFIVHYTKTVVNGFGMQTGWDSELGLEAEIIPLTRPYGLYDGNVFSGLVKINGKPVPFIEVEVEYYNREKKYAAPSDPYVTQIVKADAGGVFHYAMPKPGWWGFAALGEREDRMLNKDDHKYYPVEIGAVIWVLTGEMR